MRVSRNLFMDFEKDGLAGRLGFGDLFKSSCSKEKEMGGRKMLMRSVWELGGLGKDSFPPLNFPFLLKCFFPYKMHILQFPFP